MEPVVFIGTVVAGITEAIRRRFPQVSGDVTVLVAAVVGALIALVDASIGLPDVTLAEGMAIGLGTAGVAGIAKKVG